MLMVMMMMMMMMKRVAREIGAMENVNLFRHQRDTELP